MRNYYTSEHTNIKRLIQHMLPLKSSPLWRVPSNLNPRQRVYLDGIRYAVEMASISYQRLHQNLSELQSGGVKSGEVHGAILMLDAWSFVDSIHRLREILSQTPGIKRNVTYVQVFLRNTTDVDTLRNIVQHLRSELPSFANTGEPVYGMLTWAVMSDNRILSCFLLSGAIPSGKHNLFNPLGMKFRGELDHIQLTCKGVVCNCSETYFLLESFVSAFDTALEPQFAGHPVVGTELSGAVVISLDSTMQCENVS